jgi:STE24 endopeptidase
VRPQISSTRYIIMPFLPIIKPHYTQTPSSSSDDSPFAYAIAATLAFTLIVYIFESYLSLRQRRSYFKTEFPKELESTVGAIDAQLKSESNGTTEPKDETNDETKKEEEKKEDKVDKNQPLLPQLQSKFHKAQSYGLDRISFSIISSLYSLIEECAFLLYGFLPYVWDASASLGSKYSWTESTDEIKITLLFLGITIVIGAITSLPFELYSTFCIEKKHGFNKQTPGLFVSDKIKGLALTAIIGGPFVALLLKIIKMGGPHFYIYVWAFTFVFSVLMMTIYPVVIMPLFNKYEPLKEGKLKEEIYELAGRLEFPLTKLFVMDGSKRSSHSNAFMFGFFKNKRWVRLST